MVLISAVMHATWNVLAKRSADPLAFFFAFNLLAIVIWAPPMLVFLVGNPVGGGDLAFMFVSGLLQVAYFFALAAAYRHGALTVVYPTCRGTGVFLVPLLAIPLFDERPSLPGYFGVLAILAGLTLMGWSGRSAARVERTGLLYALLTGLIIATYSLVDNAGVGRVHPMVYVYGLIFVATIVTAPYVLWRRRMPFLFEMRHNRRSIVAGAVLSLGTYLIVLAALRLANVGYVVPLRETSIVFGTLLGITVLHEPVGRGRIGASLLVAAGAVTIAVWG